MEVPAAISVRTNEVRAGAPPGVQLLTLANGTDLRAPAFAAMFELAGTHAAASPNSKPPRPLLILPSSPRMDS